MLTKRRIGICIAFVSYLLLRWVRSTVSHAERSARANTRNEQQVEELRVPLKNAEDHASGPVQTRRFPAVPSKVLYGNELLPMLLLLCTSTWMMQQAYFKQAQASVLASALLVLVALLEVTQQSTGVTVWPNNVRRQLLDASLAPAAGRQVAVEPRLASHPLPGNDLVRQPRTQLPYTADQISGLWLKDRKASDSMDPAMELMEMRGLLRHAVRIMKGIRVLLEEDSFLMVAVSVIPLLKVREMFGLDGEEVALRRRDQRMGRAFGKVELTASGVLITLRWNEPYAGHGYEMFQLASPTELIVFSELHRQGHVVKYAVRYHKADA